MFKINPVNYSYAREMFLRYKGYMRSDIGLLSTTAYDALNGNVFDHLAEIKAFIETYGVDDRQFITDYFNLIHKYRKRLSYIIPKDEWPYIDDIFEFYRSVVTVSELKEETNA